VVAWMIIIFWMSTGSFSSHNTSLLIKPILRFLMPGLSEPKIAILHTLIRKCAHITEYFILGLLLFRFFRSDYPGSKMIRWMTSSMIVLILYAASDEFHQSFIETRTASLIDVGIDTAGGLFSQVVSALWQLHSQK
jgi:VanZ family protein